MKFQADPPCFRIPSPRHDASKMIGIPKQLPLGPRYLAVSYGPSYSEIHTFMYKYSKLDSFPIKFISEWINHLHDSFPQIQDFLPFFSAAMVQKKSFHIGISNRRQSVASSRCNCPFSISWLIQFHLGWLVCNIWYIMIWYDMIWYDMIWY